MTPAAPQNQYCGRPLPIYSADTTWLFRGQREGDEEWEDRIKEKEQDGWELKFFRHEGRNARFHRKNARRGVYGRGCFHSGLCAQWFGLAFAKDYRLKLGPVDNLLCPWASSSSAESYLT